MRLDTSQHMRQDMRMKMAPRMIQSMEILQLPIMALQERIDQELVENPVLELQDLDSQGAPIPADGEPEASSEAATDSVSSEERELVVQDSGGELDFDRLESISEDWSEHFSATHRPSSGALSDEADRKHDAMQNMASRPQSLHDYLLDQLTFMDLTPQARSIATFLIYSLDDRGFLPLKLEEVVESFGGAVTLQHVEVALRSVQRLDPLGIGARDLRECLLLQLTPDMPYYDVLQTLIGHHLEDVQQNRLPIIERRTGYDLATIKAALEQLKKFNPRPAARFINQNIPNVVPDLIVEQNEEGEYEIRLEDERTPQLYISRAYQQTLKTKDVKPEVKEYIQKKIQAARWLIESIEQRRNTLYKVAKAIIDHQKEFLDKGPESIEPLKMQQIADRVGVHVTTVSRAVDDKWVQTPRGIFPLKRFFGGGTVTADGDEVAWDTIKQKLLDIIDNEDKQNPHSDEELVDKLGEQGFNVARRTITKYRKALNIPSSRQRKQY